MSVRFVVHELAFDVDGGAPGHHDQIERAVAALARIFAGAGCVADEAEADEMRRIRSFGPACHLAPADQFREFLPRKGAALPGAAIAVAGLGKLRGVDRPQIDLRPADAERVAVDDDSVAEQLARWLCGERLAGRGCRLGNGWPVRKRLKSTGGDWVFSPRPWRASLAGLYFWGQHMDNWKMMDNDNIETKSQSDDTSSIEADLNSTNIDNVDAEVNAS